MFWTVSIAQIQVGNTPSFQEGLVQFAFAFKAGLQTPQTKKGQCLRG